MRRKKRTGILTFLVFLIFVFSMVVWASDGIEGERMDTEDTETERVIQEVRAGKVRSRKNLKA